MLFSGEPNRRINKYVGNKGKNNRKKIKFLFAFDENGKFETFDETLIDLLINKGFEHEERPLEDMKISQLRKLAGFSTYRLSKADIIKGIKAYGIHVDPFAIE